MAQFNLKLLQVGEPVLRQQARSLSAQEIRSPKIQQLIESMRETMRAAPGVGLAAPQIGESLQLAVIEDRPEYSERVDPAILAAQDRKPVPFHVIINPQLVVTEETTAEFFEGCLSLTGFIALVPRARVVRVKCLNEKAEPMLIEAQGWYARILQHEIDHLNGKLYIDHMISRSFMTVENHACHWAGQSVAQVHATLRRAEMSQSAYEAIEKKELEEQFQATRQRIKEIEEKALRKIGKNKRAPVCFACKSSINEAARMIEIGNRFYVCGSCIEDLHKKLNESGNH